MVSTKIKAALVTFVMTAFMLGGHVSASVVPKDSTDKSKASALLSIRMLQLLCRAKMRLDFILILRANQAFTG